MTSATYSGSHIEIDLESKRFISLRWRLILAFTLLFTTVFSITFYWFYNFATDRAMKKLQQDMENTLEGAIAGVNTQELLDLYKEGKSNSLGFSDDPRYMNQIRWFKSVNSIEPSAWLYTYLVRDVESSDDNVIGSELVYLVDLWSTQADTFKAAKFLQTEPCPCPQSMRIFESGQGEVDDKIYTDRFGSWLSAYAPLFQEDGEVVAILGLDLQASYVTEIQRAIRNRVLMSFTVAYIVIFILVYVFSGILTKNLNQLKIAAQKMGEGNYNQDLAIISRTRFSDEITLLAEVFNLMVGKVKGREEKLKQQVAELKIEIDESKRKQQVQEITGSDFFQDLQQKAKKLRDRKRN